MEISNQQILTEVPLISKTNNKKLVIKRYVYGSYEYINLSEQYQLKGNWYPSKTKHLTFAIDYLKDFLKSIHRVRTTRRREYEVKLHIVHNSPKGFNLTRFVGGKEYHMKIDWWQEYILSISKKNDLLFIQPLRSINDVYIPSFVFIIPNKRQIIKKLLNL